MLDVWLEWTCRLGSMNSTNVEQELTLIDRYSAVRIWLQHYCFWSRTGHTMWKISGIVGLMIGFAILKLSIHDSRTLQCMQRIRAGMASRSPTQEKTIPNWWRQATLEMICIFERSARWPLPRMAKQRSGLDMDLQSRNWQRCSGNCWLRLF